MLSKDNKLFFLIYIILFSINLSININYLQIIPLVLSFLFIFLNRILSIFFLSVWVFLFFKKKETFQIQKNNVIVKSDTYYLDILKSIPIDEKNSKLFLSKLTNNDKNNISSEEINKKRIFLNKKLSDYKNIFTSFEKYNIDVYLQNQKIHPKYKFLLNKFSIDSLSEKKYLTNFLSFNKIIDIKDIDSNQTTVWILNSLNNLLNNKNLLRNYYITKNKIEDKSRKIIENIELDYNNRNNIEFTTESGNEFVMNMQNQENIESNVAYKNKLFLDVLNDMPKNFSSIILNILEDLISLSNKIPVYESSIDLTIYYIKEIIKIITFEGRLFYVGILFLLISICLFFIEIT